MAPILVSKETSSDNMVHKNIIPTFWWRTIAIYTNIKDNNTITTLPGHFKCDTKRRQICNLIDDDKVIEVRRVHDSVMFLAIVY